MKHLNLFAIIICLSVLLSSCQTQAPKGLTDAEKAFFPDLLSNIAESWNNGDREPYVDRFTDDAVYMVPHMEALTGRDAIRTFVNTYPEANTEYQVVEVWGTSDLANVHGKFSNYDTGGELIDKGKFIAIYEKNAEGVWKETYAIWNSDIPCPAQEEEVPAQE